MYHHVKKLMYTVKVGEPDPRFGNMLLEQFGGANGELAAACNIPFKDSTAKIQRERIFLWTLAPKNSAIWKWSVR